MEDNVCATSPLDRVRKVVSSGSGEIIRTDLAAYNCEESC